MQRPQSLQMPRKAPRIFYVNRRLANQHQRRILSINCIHIIPAVVLLCVFILWWFCYPVNLEVKDGRVTVIPNEEKPISLNETGVNLAFLAAAAAAAAATPPYASTSRIPTVENQTAAQPPRATD